MKRKITTKQMVETAVLLGLGYVLSLVKFSLSGIFPGAGSITLLSMLPIVILGYKYGVAWGGLSGLIHGLLQIVEGSFYPPPAQDFISYLLVILLDYALAWAVVGLVAGVFGKVVRKPQLAMALGAFVGIFGRFLCSFTSGVIIWGVYAPEGQSAAVYSLVVNGANFLPEMIITAVAAYLVFSFSALRRQVRRADAKRSAV